MVAWEVVFLFAFSSLQLGVGTWWWQGPALDRTRGWVVALLVLNGVSTLLNGLDVRAGLPALSAASVFLDRWTNFVLVGVGLVAADPGDRLGRPGRVVLAALAGAFLVATPIHAFGSDPPPATEALFTTSLVAAGLLVVVGLLRRARAEAPNPFVWALLLSGLGFRLGELGIAFFNPGALAASDALAGLVHDATLRVGLALVPVGAIVALAIAGIDGERGEREPLALAGVLWILGIFVGFARRSISAPPSFVFFTLGVVRPAAVLASQARLQATPFTSTARARTLATGVAAGLAAALGLGLASVWGLTGTAAIVLSLGLAMFGGAVAHLARSVTDGADPAREDAAGGSGEEPIEWPLDEEQVTLPADWRERTRANFELFREQPPAIRERLAGLSRWERLILALDGASADEEGLPAYERTTPGLHFRTQCPYSAVGQEITRVNERAGRVLTERGLEAGKPTMAPPRLVEDRMGRAEGLTSPRAKIYELTPEGRRLARAIREEVGLEERSAETVARLVAEGFADAEQA
jgi:hypothetical protein